jgi:hypothetical protein
MKAIKIIILILLLAVLGYVLFPKDIGFVEEMKLSAGGAVTTVGQYNQCFGIILSEKKGDRASFRCIGIPFGGITI